MQHFMLMGLNSGVLKRSFLQMMSVHFAVIVLLCWSTAIFGASFSETVGQIESTWTQIRYVLPKPEKAKAYRRLLAASNDLLQHHPNSIEAIYWQAMVKINLAEYENKLEALNIIHEVRGAFNQVIAINPNFKQGSAYVVLGTLYYKIPSWPIAYGDKHEAEKLLKKGLEINPDGIDSNYFYGDYLQSQNRFEEAQLYFNKAIAASASQGQNLGTAELQEQAKIGLGNAKQHKNNQNVFLELFGL